MQPNRLSPFRLLSPAGGRGRLSVFIFHRVLASPDALLPWEPDAARFERIVAFIARSFHVLRLADAARAMAAGALPAAAACITFDDGYADNLGIAAPILKRHGLSATVFVATAYIDGGRMWNDTVIEAVRATPAGELDLQDMQLGCHTLTTPASRVDACQHLLGKLKYLGSQARTQSADEIARRAGLSTRSELMMTRTQLRELREFGIEVGGHTITHPILSQVDDSVAWAEIAGGREQLGEWLGEFPTTFAYPNGVPERDYSQRDVELVRKAGFDAAVTTAGGAGSAATDPFQLPRFTPWDTHMGRFGLRSAMNLARSSPVRQAPAVLTE